MIFIINLSHAKFVMWGNVHILTTNVAGALAQVLPRPQLIFPSKTWFFGIYLKLGVEII
jgi:hypothetical protein